MMAGAKEKGILGKGGGPVSKIDEPIVEEVEDDDDKRGKGAKGKDKKGKKKWFYPANLVNTSHVYACYMIYSHNVI